MKVVRWRVENLWSKIRRIKRMSNNLPTPVSSVLDLVVNPPFFVTSNVTKDLGIFDVVKQLQHMCNN